ncbi:MAG: VOC family protein [Gemmataceae bacterium]
MKKAFDHIGIITTEPQPGESWVEFSQVWVTNPRCHPQRLEFLRLKNPPDVPAENRPLWKLFHWPHVAYRVDNLAEALQGEEVIYGPFDPGNFAQVAFIHKDGLVVEYLEYHDLSHWFGQPNPPDWQPEPYGK